jgi:tetratricopeptide (TPR) repeat protein
MRDDEKLFALMQGVFAHLGLDRWTVDVRWVELYDLTARNLNNYGKVKEAASLLEEVVKIREQRLTEDHPSRLASQQVLATIYWELGDHKPALQMMKHVVAIERQVLDDGHPDLRDSEDWLEYI